MRSVVGGPPADWKTRGPILDGYPLKHCVVADEEEGYCDVYQISETGIRMHQLPLRRLYGIVKLVPVDEAYELGQRIGWWHDHNA